MEKNEELKFVDAILNDDNIKANSHLENIIKKKVAKKIADTLNK